MLPAVSVIELACTESTRSSRSFEMTKSYSAASACRAMQLLILSVVCCISTKKWLPYAHWPMLLHSVVLTLCYILPQSENAQARLFALYTTNYRKANVIWHVCERLHLCKPPSVCTAVALASLALRLSSVTVDVSSAICLYNAPFHAIA